MADIPEMNLYRFLDPDFLQGGTQLFCQGYSIVVGAAGGAKTRHRHTPDSLSVKAQPVKSPYGDQKCQGRI